MAWVWTHHVLWCWYIEAFTGNVLYLWTDRHMQIHSNELKSVKTFQFSSLTLPAANLVLMETFPQSAHANKIVEIAAHLVSQHQHCLRNEDTCHSWLMFHILNEVVCHHINLNDPWRLEKMQMTLIQLVLQRSIVVILNIPSTLMNVELCLCIWIISLEVMSSNKLKLIFGKANTSRSLFCLKMCPNIVLGTVIKDQIVSQCVTQTPPTPTIINDHQHVNTHFKPFAFWFIVKLFNVLNGWVGEALVKRDIEVFVSLVPYLVLHVPSS